MSGIHPADRQYSIGITARPDYSSENGRKRKDDGTSLAVAHRAADFCLPVMRSTMFFVVKKGSNTWASTPGAMPHPESATVKRGPGVSLCHVVASRERSTILPLRGVASMAACWLRFGFAVFKRPDLERYPEFVRIVREFHHISALRSSAESRSTDACGCGAAPRRKSMDSPERANRKGFGNKSPL